METATLSSYVNASEQVFFLFEKNDFNRKAQGQL